MPETPLWPDGLPQTWENWHFSASVGELSVAEASQDWLFLVSSQLHGSTSRTLSLLSFFLSSLGPASNKAQECSVGYSSARQLLLERAFLGHG